MFILDNCYKVVEGDSDLGFESSNLELTEAL